MDFYCVYKITKETDNLFFKFRLCTKIKCQFLTRKEEQYLQSQRTRHCVKGLTLIRVYGPPAGIKKEKHIGLSS